MLSSRGKRWWRQTPRRAAEISGIALALLLVWVASGNPAWATPSQSPLRQSIPTRIPTPIPSWIWVGTAVGSPTDYAPSGMPDLDQQQNDWHAVDDPSRWTHDGPVAVADAVWWLDSSLESSTTPPPAVTNTSYLLSPYGNWDDHDPRNVVPFVNDLAARLDTNGAQSGQPHLGTDISAIVPALQDYLMQQGLLSRYAIRLVRWPSFEQLVGWIRQGDSVIVYLGLWQDQGAQWIYFGGHYAAVAGAEPANQLLALCDPLRDAYEAHLMAQGREGAAHDYPHAHDVHNDVRYVSQDAYAIGAPSRPGGAAILRDYGFVGEGQPDHLAFMVGQNPAAELEALWGEYSGGGGEAELNYAVVVSCYRLYLPVILRRSS